MTLEEAITEIRAFIESCDDIYTSRIRTPDGVELYTDWGYFEEGLEEIERYLRGKKNGKID